MTFELFVIYSNTKEFQSVTGIEILLIKNFGTGFFVPKSNIIWNFAGFAAIELIFESF